MLACVVSGMAEAQLRWAPLSLQLSSQDGCREEGRRVVRPLHSLTATPESNGAVPLTSAAINAGAMVWALQWCPYNICEGKRVSRLGIARQDE